MKRKHGLLLFIAACIPGCGEMYQGYMKRGVSILTAFCAVFALAAFLMGMMMDRKQKSSIPWMMVTSIVGLIAYYGMGGLYFYFISNYVIRMPVGWKVVLINCCLLTIFEDFLLCVLAVLICSRLKPGFQRMILDQ